MACGLRKDRREKHGARHQWHKPGCKADSPRKKCASCIEVLTSHEGHWACKPRRTQRSDKGNVARNRGANVKDHIEAKGGVPHRVKNAKSCQRQTQCQTPLKGKRATGRRDETGHTKSPKGEGWKHPNRTRRQTRPGSHARGEGGRKRQRRQQGSSDTKRARRDPYPLLNYPTPRYGER